MSAEPASTLGQRLRTDLLAEGWCVVEVDSEFRWRNVRRLARAIGRQHGLRVHSHLLASRSGEPWPRSLALWDESREITAADRNRAALAMDAWLRSALRDN